VLTFGFQETLLCERPNIYLKTLCNFRGLPKISKREKMMSDSMSVLPENKLLSKSTSWPKTVVTQSEGDKVLLAYYFGLMF